MKKDIYLVIYSNGHKKQFHCFGFKEAIIKGLYYLIDKDNSIKIDIIKHIDRETIIHEIKIDINWSKLW